MTDLRYPIGPFTRPDRLDGRARTRAITEIAAAPSRLREAVGGLDEKQLDTPYRPAGWTVRQVVHHIPDSHVNAYVRTKLCLTEPQPTIKTYEEAQWAMLPDSKGPIGVSLGLLGALHQRWVGLLEQLAESDFARTLNHPEWGILRLDQLVAMYAWHGKHHVAHITGLRTREGW
jgi:hypothetical protein